MKKEVQLTGLLLLGFSLSSWVPAEETALSFQECVNLAKENNRKQKISQADIYIAEQLLKQARSSYWPTVSMGMMATRMDEDPVYSIDEFQLGAITVPSQQTKAMDRDNFATSITASVPLFTGGYRGALTDQAKQGISAAHEAARRTELELIRDVRRFYYGTVTAAKQVQLAADTVERMETTESLTQRLYQTGTGMVKKTDYLRVKAVNSMLRATRSEMTGRHRKALSALNHTIGMDRTMFVVPSEQELPTPTVPPTAEALMNTAMSKNPDLARIRAGIYAAEAGIRAARSGHYPKVGAFATYGHMENDYDKGLADPVNKDTGIIGLRLHMPLFSGFRTVSETAEAKKKLEKLQLQEHELMEGIRLKIELAHIDWTCAYEKSKAVTEGLAAAKENRDLNIRAYGESLVETRDVIQAQLVEALLALQQTQTAYDCMTQGGEMSFLTGKQTHEE